ncbi:helix-turn-helix domain-containing protein [Amycolatopsis sp. cg5]|uniref:helix-turn-helix domain-containing protein n=1 Tax=Amycolatopsis sp. cg5 TaxID=3238802 RepID=UPI003525CD5B
MTLRIWFDDVESGEVVPVGKLVRRTRDKRNLTLSEAAKLMGIAPTTLGQIESGFRSVKGIVTIVHLADGLGLPRTQVFEWAVMSMKPPAVKVEPC